MSYDILCIGGGFDVIHRDHKEFIDRCINVFSEKYGTPKHLIVRLHSDYKLNHKKGYYRPFFSYEWRAQDISEFLRNKANFSILKIDSLDFKSFCIKGVDMLMKEDSSMHLTADKIVMAVRVDDMEFGKDVESLGLEVVYVPTCNKFHTTDIERRLLSSREKSNCKIRKVGALLLRDGEIVKEGYSGNGDCNCCSKYKIYSVTGKASQNTPCDFPHAEEVCLEDAKKGDDLFITCSPCMSCAEKIVSKGIRRVVFLEEYYDIKPLEYLHKNGVSFRKAGIG